MKSEQKETKDMVAATLDRDKTYVEKKFQEKELKHLKVTKRGVNIVIYSDDEESGKDNRCRFTYVKSGQYILNMANHKGKWEPTPFKGTLEELLEMVIEQFPWTLTDYYREEI